LQNTQYGRLFDTWRFPYVVARFGKEVLADSLLSGQKEWMVGFPVRFTQILLKEYSLVICNIAIENHNFRCIIMFII
jgi:hypothetical protein